MTLKYEPSLDGLRALAVLAVICYHARAPFALGGARGVEVFFVLSGYLITSQLAGGDLSVLEFWKRRALRLAPALILMVGLTVAFAPVAIPQYAATAPRDGLLAATYLMNVAEGLRPWDNPFMHTWSLAAEAQFYLAWPFLLPILARWHPAITLPALWLAFTGLQAAVTAFTPFEGYYFPHFGGLALGAAVAYLPPMNRWAAAAGLGAILMAFINPALPAPLAEAGAAMLVSAVRLPCAVGSLLSVRPLTRMGLISYGVYLYHFPIHCAFEATPWFVRGGAALGGSLALGALSFHFVEKPLRGRRMRPAIYAAQLTTHDLS